MHVACLVRWIEVSGRTHCAACGEVLRGVAVRKRVTVRTRAKRGAWLVLFATAFVVPVYFTTILMHNASADHSYFLAAFLLCYEVLVCATILGAWAQLPRASTRAVHIELPASARVTP